MAKIKTKITKEQYESAKELMQIFEEQIIEERKARVPKFGDTVRCLCTTLGRYIGNGQALYISSMTNDIFRDLIDMEASWENAHSLPLPTDTELIEGVRANDWIK